MAKAELGTKRICPETGRKFYDLGKTPVISPYTGKVVPIAPLPQSRSRPEPAAPAPVARPAPAPEPEVIVPETADAEFVSLEDAEAEQQGKKPAAEGAAAGEIEEVEIDESPDDAAFIEEEEEGDPDVTDIIGETIEKEEET
ncbi:MAG: TIGR02300 family protein [Pseudolabrys sp.]